MQDTNIKPSDESYQDTYFPKPQGLFDPRFEHDACGAGFVCNINGEKSHQIVLDAIQILERLTHRGAAGHDGESGDGAGIMIQIPHEYFQKVMPRLGVNLPESRQYATGLVFMPPDPVEKASIQKKFEEVICKENQQFLSWRDVPVNPEILGTTALKSMPKIVQVFIKKGNDSIAEREFERKLFVIRKVIENYVYNSRFKQKSYFYIPTLSCRVMVYKGLLMPEQIINFYLDLQDEAFKSAFGLVHQRYSTNTFPAWPLAQPFRMCCHNGEINTVNGNKSWLKTRESLFSAKHFGDDINKITPIITEHGSDSANLDNALELLYHTNRSLPHAISMLIPEAWEHNDSMPKAWKAFYEFQSCLMEPWDGPAFVPFTDGDSIGAVLDRNGLRPARFTLTSDGMLVMASETGVLDIPNEKIIQKGRLEPGKLFLVDLNEKRIIDNTEIKDKLAGRQNYRKWLDKNQLHFKDLDKPIRTYKTNSYTLFQRQKLFGYSQEDLKVILTSLAKDGKEPIGSMGDDIPLAVLSNKPRLLFDYFKQLFAQVTNPPLDAIREEMVTSLSLAMGKDKSLFYESQKHCRLFQLEQPILTNEQLAQIRVINHQDILSKTLSIVYPIQKKTAGLAKAIDKLCIDAATAIKDGYSIIVLSDRDVGKNFATIPSLLATSAVHHYLIEQKLRTQCGLVVESAEPREVHHFAMLIGYGASAINPYLAFETLEALLQKKLLGEINYETAEKYFINAIGKGLLKVMSKMGISTLKSYLGAKVFECVGLSDKLIQKYFSGTISRVQGIDLDDIHNEIASRHQFAFQESRNSDTPELPFGGKYSWRRNSENHQWHPLTIAKLQKSTRLNDFESYQEYTQFVNQENKAAGTLRGMLEFKKDVSKRIPIEEVESWQSIVKRFKTGAMSYGSISKEAHETIAVAMNKIGGKSNSGEGGEDSDRFLPDSDGNLKRSAIKQVASGRFGVTINYLTNADEIQIKMAQGAKPGEGGQLPAYKVFPDIAKTRHSTPWVGLISPPPHHDIYSIEDLAQLIFDLKNANPKARINVKLVSVAGVGTIAAGVAKGNADVVLISGGDGGTGASALTSLKHTGLPWELGVAEAHQTLVLNNLRDRIIIEVDGQLKTGRDIAIAALLGAQEFGFSTAPLIAMGCIMMRVCHLNTCPVGIATQDPDLRKKFNGTPEHIINYFYFIANELREIMANLGFRTVDEMIGKVDCLQTSNELIDGKANKIDLSKLIYSVKRSNNKILQNEKKVDLLQNQIDHSFILQAENAIKSRKKVTLSTKICNTDRAVGALLSNKITQYHGEIGLPNDCITINCEGNAGQSFAAFSTKGITFNISGDANDYFGKGLSGAKLIIKPPHKSQFAANENIIIGNVALYGATSGEAYISGVGGERFCVRNSGVNAVIEGVGDHGCEYMTGGNVVVLGKTGRNFAAGMSGGFAFIFDEKSEFSDKKCNLEMVELEEVIQSSDKLLLKQLVQNHLEFTKSKVAKRILTDWENQIKKFVKVIPTDYKNALKMKTQVVAVQKVVDLESEQIA